MTTYETKYSLLIIETNMNCPFIAKIVSESTCFIICNIIICIKISHFIIMYKTNNAHFPLKGFINLFKTQIFHVAVQSNKEFISFFSFLKRDYNNVLVFCIRNKSFEFWKLNFTCHIPCYCKQFYFLCFSLKFYIVFIPFIKFLESINKMFPISLQQL